MKVEPIEATVFIGAVFKIELGRGTIGALRAELKKMDDELKGWGGDSVEIEVVEVHQNRGIHVALTTPIWR